LLLEADMLSGTVEQLGQDVRNGVRAFGRDRAMTAAAVLALALGIGANTAIFSVAHAYLLRVWQVQDPEQLAFVRARSSDGERTGDFPWQTVERLRMPTQSFSSLSAVDGSTVTITIDGQPEIVHADFVTGDYFLLLGLMTPLGRSLTLEDDLPGRPPVAVISHAYWRQRFGADPHVIGKAVALKDLVCTIVGVTGPTYFGRQTAGDAPALTLPMTWHGALGLKDHLSFELLGRVRTDVTREGARAELDAIYQRALTEQRVPGVVTDPSRAPATSHIEFQSAARGDFDDERFAREVWILQLVAALVLLLATVNVAGLQLARGAGRRREIATRLALGATRPRLIRQMLAESLLVSAAGGILGLCAAQWGADALLALTVGTIPLTSPVLQGPIVAFTLAMILLAALLSGMMPALRLTRTDQMSRMSTSLRTRAGDRAPRGSWSLVVVQVALSIVVLIPAGLLVRSVERLARVDLGFNPDRLLVMSVYPTLAGYEGARELELYERLLDRLNALPGVEAASLSRFPILRSARWRGLTIHGEREIVDSNASFVVDAAAPRFFAVLGLRFLSGRDFSRSDTARSPRVAVINQALADRYFPEGRAVGRSLEFDGVRREIISVVANMRFGVRDEQSTPAVYIAYTQAPPDMLGQMWLKIRTTGEPAALLPTIRQELQNVAPTLAPAWSSTGSASISSASTAEASLATLVSTSGAVALFLAMVGLYGTMTQAVMRRTREIGIRVALGAQAHEVTGMILREVGQLLVAGVAIGVPCAWASAHVVASFLFGVGPANLSTTLLCCVAVAGVSAVAGFVPARRAARIDPMVALQRE
jgi:predicted permease